MNGRIGGTVSHRLAGAIEHLFPGYFAMVMATGSRMKEMMNQR